MAIQSSKHSYGSTHTTSTGALLRLVALSACLCVSILSAAAAEGSSKRSRRHKEPLKLNFYAQEYFLTGTPTTFFVVPPLAGLGTSLTSQTFLGAIALVDPAITLTPDANSTEIGRLKGASLFGNSVAPTSPDVEVVWDVVFNDASGYGDSTLSFRGYYQTLKPARELSISGGTGHFRLARGWAVVTTYFLDPATARAINNFTVYVHQ